MKILLAKPITESIKRVHIVPPLSLGYLAGALRGDNDVSILDCERLGYDAEDFGHYLRLERPELVGITVFSHNSQMVRRSISIIKEIDPTAVVVLGGPHINARGSRIFQEFPGIDYAIQGEAEQSLAQLVYVLKEKKHIGEVKIPGLIFTDDQGCVNVTPKKFVDDISQFDPMPYDLLNLESYFGGVPHGMQFRHKELASIITSRGCPYPCTFCAGSLSSGKKVRYRSIDNVIEELRILTGRYGVREIHIIDDNFTFSKDYAKQLCEEIIRSNFNIKLALPNGIRLDKIDSELLSIMRKAGFYAISFGIESGSDETLRKIRKMETTGFFRKRLKMVKQHGFVITGTFIIGFPWETKDEVEKTLRFAKSLPLDHAAFGNFIPLPGTELTEYLIQTGELKEDHDVPYVFGDITYCPPNMSANELKKLQLKCVISFYFPKRLHHIIRNIRISNIVFLLRRALILLKRI